MRFLTASLGFYFFLSLTAPLAGAATPARPGGGPLPSLEVMVGQMIMTGFRGTGLPPLNPNLNLLLEDVRSGKIGGVILFDRDWTTKTSGRNILSREQVKNLAARLQEAAPIPLFIAVDQEGGRVRRLKPEHGFPDAPSARSLGTGSPEHTFNEAARLGQALRENGINVNFAPVADVATANSPAIARLDRAFSDSPVPAAAHAAAFARGQAKAGIISAYKHFPGHGSAATDTHHGVTDISASWRPDELLPYTPGNIPSGIPLMVMTGHLFLRQYDDAHPASLSSPITTGLLRNTLGWSGVIITDDLQMEAITQSYGQEESLRLALLAGADILLLGNNLRYDPLTGRKMHAAVMALVNSGQIGKERIAASWRRIMNLKAAIPGMSGAHGDGTGKQ